MVFQRVTRGWLRRRRGTLWQTESIRSTSCLRPSWRQQSNAQLNFCLSAHRHGLASSASFSKLPSHIRFHSTHSSRPGPLRSAVADGDFLSVTWHDGQTSRYPFIFLRDSCPCVECLHVHSQQRLYDFISDGVPVDVRPMRVEVCSVLTFLCARASACVCGCGCNACMCTFVDSQIDCLKLSGTCSWTV